MHAFDWLDRDFLGNSIRAWLTAIAILVVVFIVLVVLRELIRRRLLRAATRDGGRAAERAESLAASAVNRTRYFAFLAVAIAAGSLDLNLPPSWRQAIADLTIVALALQVALWGDGLIAYAVQHYTSPQRSPDPNAPSHVANTAAVGAVGVGARIALWLLVMIIALDAVGIRVTTLVAGLGISGIAIALALQSVLGDAFAALSIVLDKPLVIGDDIGVDTVRGRVERIGMKNTRLRANTGEVVIIANADLLKSRIQNFSQMRERTVTFTVTLDPATPPDAIASVPGLIRDIISAQSGVRFIRSHVTQPTDRGIGVETSYVVMSPDQGRFMEVQQATTLGLIRGLEKAPAALAKPSGTTIVVTPTHGVEPKSAKS